MYSSEQKNKLVETILSKLKSNKEVLKKNWENSTPVKHFFLDDVFDSETVQKLAVEFPKWENLIQRDSIRERKKVGVDLDSFHKILSDFQYCFLDENLLSEIEQITSIKNLIIDPSLYASGVSVMAENDFLNPHLDNSHDGDRKAYRVLNILFYCSINWEIENGGNLELWSEDLKEKKLIHSKFNRLVVMETNQKSWHSVNKILINKQRNCISNYYFSTKSPAKENYFHVTSFRGRPEEFYKNILLQLDSLGRNFIRKLFPNGILKTKHRLKSKTN
jgi:Rps23 Pro-64 3,4-dihydroxylase Tpa1-like proline 4-hydroxylase